jgi:predicted metal-binding protein
MWGREMKVVEFVTQLGIETWFEFGSEMLVPEERIRAFCLENKCGNYRSNYMCPPYVGSLEEITIKLKKFRRGVLLQYAKFLNVRGDSEGVRQTKIDFHNKILRIEELLRVRGINEVWGMIGGNCGLCDTCGAKMGEPCVYPDKARMSLEAIGVDVLELLDRFGLDSEFHADKITWTGCILLQGTPTRRISHR